MLKRCLSQPFPCGTLPFRCCFQTTRQLAAVRPFLLSDPGEGIREVQIIQWFVEPGARVEEWDKICEVASDKANVEITSRFDGVIKKLHYEPEDVVQVGQGDVAPEDEAVLAPEPQQAGKEGAPQQPQKAAQKVQETDNDPEARVDVGAQTSSGTDTALATPAVRGVLKELGVNIAEVKGTGRDGRVLKEDVHRFVADRNTTTQGKPRPTASSVEEAQAEKSTNLTPIQSQMFKTMTRSLSIPHFVYADEVDITALSGLRRRLNAHGAGDRLKLSYLHFIVKAVSLALEEFPLLNARIEAGNDQQRPQLIMREKHNIGIAMDTSQGLLVPNIKNVSSRSIGDIASECSRLQALAKESRLSARDMTGGTITVSNVGSIGGTYVAPIIVQSEIAILGLGKARTVPAYNQNDEVVKKEIMNFSWSADHRVVDGATIARMAQRVKDFVEEPGLMVTRLR
ncbi:MAG: hypothetical protein Q9217_002924 [Psora testacea]